MDYNGLWKVLEAILLELKEKGTDIPQETMNDLKSAKTMIDVYKVDPTYSQASLNIEKYLWNVEARLINLAEIELGTKYAHELLERIEKTRRTEIKPLRRSTSKFIPGLPRGKDWIRIKITDLIDQEEIETLIEGCQLQYKMQEDGYLLVYGDRDKIKILVAEMAKKMKEKKD